MTVSAMRNICNSGMSVLSMLAVLVSQAVAYPTPLSIGDVDSLSGGPPTCTGVVTNGTRPGQDYASIKMNTSTGETPIACQALCCNDPNCATWSVDSPISQRVASHYHWNTGSLFLRVFTQIAPLARSAGLKQQLSR